MELTSDEVTGPQAARILSAVLHRPIAHPQATPGPVTPMAPFFQWVAEIGFHADIRRLRHNKHGTIQVSMQRKHSGARCKDQVWMSIRARPRALIRQL